MSHTPGPWQHCQDLEPNQSLVILSDEDVDESSDARAVASVMGDRRYENSRLIAAAPELLGALKGLISGDIDEAREVIEYGPGGTTKEEAASKLIIAREDAARDAIFKATGGQP